MANYLSLARGALERGDVESARRRLESVRQGLDRAALVVRQVLAHADPAKAPRTSVDINRVLAESTEFVRSRPEFAGVRFESALAETPLTVEGNPIMLGQVALNLIVNACEAQPGGGEVRVSSEAAEGSVRAEVADRGPGIAAGTASASSSRSSRPRTRRAWACRSAIPSCGSTAGGWKRGRGRAAAPSSR